MKADFAIDTGGVSTSGLLLASTARLLGVVDELPSGATGVLAFGEDGVILVENKRICLALAGDMRQRLTDILCQQSDPPLPHAAVEEVLRRCKRDGTSVVHALASSGVLSEEGFLAALGRHNAEAIARLARARTTRASGFTPHLKCGYGPRFVFGTLEMLAAIAGKRRPRLALEARARIAQLRALDISTFAFAREAAVREPLVVGVSPDCALTVRDALELGAFALASFDVSLAVDAATTVVLATWCSRLSVVCWREQEVFYVAVCGSRPASALLLRQLELGALPDRPTGSRVRVGERT